VFQKTGQGKYLVGTFNGLYDWSHRDGVPRDWSGVSYNHFSGKAPEISNTGSKPFGDEMVSGYLKLKTGVEIYFDYNRGAIILNSKENMPAMPAEILAKSPMSWWNFALEVHTGRIFKPFTGEFYILIVPLLGIFGTILVISGLIVWIKLYARKNR
jgi:hypothetical protein